jgi:flavin reductase (DIM6/NTAB) family NADH-FMN oxidoreductase RutF
VSRIEPASGQGPDTAALRRALGCFVTGVTVVTTRGAGGLPHGFTANSFTSVSLDPPLLLVCVGHAVESLEVYRECEGFAINVLADSQRAISDTFATKHPDRFAGVRWREGSYGSPLLEGCVASLECASWQRIEAGDHMILIGRVVALEHSTGRPLAFCHGSYLSLPPERDIIMHEDGRAVRPVL